MSSPASSRFDAVIVGGGAGGTLVAARLLDGDASGGHSGHRVALVETRPALAEGVAYSTRRPEHLLNVRAAGMSAFDERPDDFVRFLHGLPEHADVEPATLGARFMPRRDYARYLASLLQSRDAASRLHTVAGEVVDVMPVADGFDVVLASGERLRTRAVVLATGNRSARLPLAQPAVLPAAAQVNAWDYPAVAAIAPETDVCILGAGLSMVDVVLTLRSNGHRGRIVSLSRHGLVPLPHPAPCAPAVIEMADLLPLGVRARMHALRSLAMQAQTQGQPWQTVLDGLRPHVQALWTSLPEPEQRRFLRHAVRVWDIHRHRIAPEVAMQLEEARASGQLHHLAGHMTALEAGPPLRIGWRPRGGDQTQWLEAGVLVNALGMDKRIEGGSGLPARLCARGLLRPGPHRIGAATTGDGVPLGADGAPVAGLWTLGALRVGELWESIAMPELRGQALRVARAVHARLTAPD